MEYGTEIAKTVKEVTKECRNFVEDINLYKHSNRKYDICVRYTISSGLFHVSCMISV